MIWIFFFCAGLCVGSFLNVCIWRLPRKESVVRPRSRCPNCRHPIAWYDNIPVLSYLMLAGRCRNCRKPVSLRYPLVELSMGLLAYGLWRHWGADPMWVAAACVACAALLAIAFIDWDTFLIPDELSLGLLALGPLAAFVNPMFSGGPLWRLGSCAIGAAAGFAICWGIAELGEFIFKKEAMGGGDVKLLAAVGAWGGALGAFDCLILASLFGSVYGVWLMARGKIRRQDPIPFGPFLSAAAIFNFFYLLPFGFPFLMD